MSERGVVFPNLGAEGRAWEARGNLIPAPTGLTVKFRSFDLRAFFLHFPTFASSSTVKGFAHLLYVDFLKDDAPGLSHRVSLDVIFSLHRLYQPACRS